MNFKFEITQKNGEILLLAIIKYLHLNTKVYQEKPNFYRAPVISPNDIFKVVDFIQNAPVKLKGYKKNTIRSVVTKNAYYKQICFKNKNI